MDKQNFIDAMMRFSHDAWGGDAIPSDEDSFAEVYDYVFKSEIIDPAKARDDLFELMDDKHDLTLSDYQLDNIIYCVLNALKIECKDR